MDVKDRVGATSRSIMRDRLLPPTILHTYKHDSESVVNLSGNSTLDETFQQNCIKSGAIWTCNTYNLSGYQRRIVRRRKIVLSNLLCVPLNSESLLWMAADAERARMRWDYCDFSLPSCLSFLLSSMGFDAVVNRFSLLRFFHIK